MPIQLGVRQQGATLIVCLVFLLVLTMIGVSSIQSATLQEQMAGSARDYNAAFLAAEFSLREGESYLQSASLGDFAGAQGRFAICSPASTATACMAPSWSNRASTGWVTQSGLGQVSTQPQYIIEKYPVVVDVNAPLDADTPPVQIEVYRVTARGFGVSEHSMTVLQTTYRR